MRWRPSKLVFNEDQRDTRKYKESFLLDVNV